jgi:SAM-dependent methyltransferase
VEAETVWESGEPYEAYVGRWSLPIARQFAGWLNVGGGGRWLDVGCGTGALSRAIADDAEPSLLAGVDPSAGFVAHARRRFDGAGGEFAVSDAQFLPFADDSFDASVAGLVLNFVPEPARALAEMARATRAGGVVAAYVWDYAGKMEMLRYFWDAAAALDPGARALDEGRLFPLCAPDELGGLFRAAGLRGVAVKAIDAPTLFRDFQDFWLPFTGGQGPAPGYAVSLSEERRSDLREYVRSSLPFASDGSLPLVARAWAVRGTA